MANPEHLQILKRGVEVWNQWRRENQDVLFPDLQGADLREAHLSGAYLSGADLSGAHLQKADLQNADFREANLREADLREAYLVKADLREANLSEADLRSARLDRARLNEAFLSVADLSGTYLRKADLSGARLDRARLSEADLSGAILHQAYLTGALLLKTNFEGADLTGCVVYGISAWNVNLVGAQQSDLVITPYNEPVITVDNLEVAQFIYLLLHNEKIRGVIDTITSKAVLILGRFTPERKTVLDAIREELRKYDYVPIVFDFDKPASRDTHETITMLARMARFVIADITEAKSIPQELVSIVETLPSVPVKPILQHGCEPWGMYDHIKNYPWVLKLHRYRNLDDLISSLEAKVITPVAARAKKLLKRKVK